MKQQYGYPDETSRCVMLGAGAITIVILIISVLFNYIDSKYGPDSCYDCAPAEAVNPSPIHIFPMFEDSE